MVLEEKEEGGGGRRRVAPMQKSLKQVDRKLTTIYVFERERERESLIHSPGIILWVS